MREARGHLHPQCTACRLLGFKVLGFRGTAWHLKGLYGSYTGITLGLYWDYIGGYIGVIVGLCWDYIGVIVGVYYSKK